MTIYATYFDRNYLDRGIALISSVRKFDLESKIIVLILDEMVSRVLLDLFPQIQILTENDLSDYEPRLESARQGRSRIEQYFTQTPILMKKILSEALEGEICVYLDADLFFFNDPQLVLAEMGDSSIGIIEHKYEERMFGRLKKYGTFNVGWVGIRNDDNGQRCVDWWSDSCLNWCFDKAVEGKFADQGYLDQFPRLFQGVSVLKHLGFNLAPWNVGNYQFVFKDSSLYINDTYPLIFFHFHGLSKIQTRYFSGEIIYRAKLHRSLKKHAYGVYVSELERILRSLPENLAGPTVVPRGKGIRLKALRLRKIIFRAISLLVGNTIETK